MSKLKIHFIIEGQVEEREFFNLIKEYGQSENIEISYKESIGAGNIAAYYQNELASENYDLVFCVYDVDGKIKDYSSPYNQTRNKLLKVLGSDKKVDEISLCTNPNILLIILLGFDCPNNLMDLTPSKTANTNIIKKYCPKIGNKKQYKAHEWQVKLIFDSFDNKEEAYEKIISCADTLSKDYKNDKIASNLIIVLREIKNGNVAYFENIIKILNGEKNVNSRRKKKN